MKTDFEKELMERVIRLESRVVQLGDHVGANLRTKQRIDISGDKPGDGLRVTVDSLDVSLSRIYQELNRYHQDTQGLKGDTVPVFWKGKQVALVYL